MAGELYYSLRGPEPFPRSVRRPSRKKIGLGFETTYHPLPAATPAYRHPGHGAKHETWTYTGFWVAS